MATPHRGFRVLIKKLLAGPLSFLWQPLLLPLSNLLSMEARLELLQQILAHAVQTQSPDEALRFLFKLDAYAYGWQGHIAIAYNQGIHPKHRHIGYHDFFCQRIHDGERILDLGCGNGALAFSMANQALVEILAVDIHLGHLEQARQLHPHGHIHYIQADALEPLNHGTFDVLVLSNLLEHLPDRSAFLRRKMAESKAKRVLIRVPLFERDWRVPLKQELGVPWKLDATHEIEYTRESFDQEMESAGLCVIYNESRWGELWVEAIPIQKSLSQTGRLIGSPRSLPIKA